VSQSKVNGYHRECIMHTDAVVLRKACYRYVIYISRKL